MAVIKGRETLKTELPEIEREKIIRAQKGDMNAFCALVDAYKERTVRIAFSLTGNLADAQDIAQEAFVRVFGKIKNFKFNSKFSTWLYRVTVNVSRDFLRNRKRSRLVFGSQETHAYSVRAEGPDPAKRLMDKELGHKIDNAVLALPEKQQVAFILKYKQDMAVGEIAQILDVSVATVKVHLFRAIHALQKKLQLEQVL